MRGRLFALLVLVPFLLLAISGCKEEPQPKIKGGGDPNLQPAAVGGPGKEAPPHPGLSECFSKSSCPVPNKARGRRTCYCASEIAPQGHARVANTSVGPSPK